MGQGGGRSGGTLWTLGVPWGALWGAEGAPNSVLSLETGGALGAPRGALGGAEGAEHENWHICRCFTAYFTVISRLFPCSCIGFSLVKHLQSIMIAKKNKGK